MKIIRTFLSVTCLFVIFFSWSSFSFAASEDYVDPGATVLPGTDKSVEKCESVMRWVNVNTTVYEYRFVADGSTVTVNGEPLSVKDMIASRESSITAGDINVSYTEILACAIKTGEIKMWMVPFFIRYVLEFIIGLAGLISVGGIVYGGYLYLFAGISDDKDKGKNAIKNSVLGLILSLTAWAIVNIVISLVTA